MNSLIKTHKALAEAIRGRVILAANSLGKDSVLALEWLSNYAQPAQVISFTYRFFAEHPDDGRYLEYLKKRYPNVLFVFEPSPQEVSRHLLGVYQNPLDVLKLWNHQEFDTFLHQKMTEDLRVQYGADYVSFGVSRYESFDRACWFHKHGILDDESKQIFPLGMMFKDQVFNLIRLTGLKLHPCYGLGKSTLDTPSWYKGRATFLKYPHYYERVLEQYPLLELDRYRYERLLNGKK